MAPLTVDVLAPRLVVLDRAPEGMAYAQQMLDEDGARARHETHQYPDDIWQEHKRLLGWMTELAKHYRQRIRIRLIDPRSFLGLYKGFRHWLWRYPSFIVEGEIYTGWEKESLDDLIQRHLLN